jgi:hypothetical protein
MRKLLNKQSVRSKNIDATFNNIGIDLTKKNARMLIQGQINVKSEQLYKTDLIRLRKFLDIVIKQAY